MKKEYVIASSLVFVAIAVGALAYVAYPRDTQRTAPTSTIPNVMVSGSVSIPTSEQYLTSPDRVEFRPSPYYCPQSVGSCTSQGFSTSVADYGDGQGRYVIILPNDIKYNVYVSWGQTARVCEYPCQNTSGTCQAGTLDLNANTQSMTYDAACASLSQ